MRDERDEQVRLVIWDLDETFWRGTVSEGGIQEYIDAHHDIVIELARRGIMSSICSKNNFEEIKQILMEKEIWDYFIFPSIDWSPKPGRVKDIIENVQLRPSTIMFIDDNATNRASVKLEVPELKVESETVIPNILTSRLFSGKNDPDFSRLKQYKLLEKRSVEKSTAPDQHEFLRSSNIAVEIEVDLEPHYERIVELINRTNQLNFTKNRLSEELDVAVVQLKDYLRKGSHAVRAGLLKVRDRYGDYGYAGFYAQRWGRLEHFCFSCRILGFGVEAWLYQTLGRPELAVVGEVLVDVKSAPKIDWISVGRFGESLPDISSSMRENAEVILRGKCELGILIHYLQFAKMRIKAEWEYIENNIELCSDSVVNMYYTSGPRWEETKEDFRQIGFTNYRGCRIFDSSEVRGPIVFFGHRDFSLRPVLYKHGKKDLILNFYLKDFTGDLCLSDFDVIAKHVTTLEPNPDRVELVLSSVRCIRENYQSVAMSDEDKIEFVSKCLTGVLSFLHNDMVVMPILLYPLARNHKGVLLESKMHINSNSALRMGAGADCRVEFIDIGDFISTAGEVLDWYHYDRIVYHRIANAIIAKCKKMSSLR